MDYYVFLLLVLAILSLFEGLLYVYLFPYKEGISYELDEVYKIIDSIKTGKKGSWFDFSKCDEVHNNYVELRSKNRHINNYFYQWINVFKIIVFVITASAFVFGKIELQRFGIYIAFCLPNAVIIVVNSIVSGKRTKEIIQQLQETQTLLKNDDIYSGIRIYTYICEKVHEREGRAFSLSVVAPAAVWFNIIMYSLSLGVIVQ